MDHFEESGIQILDVDEQGKIVGAPAIDPVDVQQREQIRSGAATKIKDWLTLAEFQKTPNVTEAPNGLRWEIES